MPHKSNIILALIDKVFSSNIFTDTRDFRVFLFRMLNFLIIFACVYVYVFKDDIMKVYQESKFENYEVILEQHKDLKFKETAKEQLIYIQMTTQPDFSTILSFRPRNQNYFADMIAYDGFVPQEINADNYSYAINRTTNEYKTHVMGLSYESTSSAYLPMLTKYSYVYSCPYFNLDNRYSGTITLFWKEPNELSKQKLDVICFQAARILGRAQ